MYIFSLPRTEKIFTMPKNVRMTPIERIEAERKKRGMTAKAVYTAFDVSRQSYTNYKTEGLPAKLYTKADDIFGKPYGWAEYGIETEASQPELVADPKMRVVLTSVQDMFMRIPQDQWHLALIEISSALVKSGRARP